MAFYPKHLTVVVLLSFVTSFAAAQPVLAHPCEQQAFEEAKFIVCTATPGHDDLRLFWKDTHGDPYRRFPAIRSEEHTSELQSLMRISYAVFCLKKNNQK